MPATGSDSRTPGKELSIRLRRDGLSFSVRGGRRRVTGAMPLADPADVAAELARTAEKHGCGTITVAVDTPDVLFMPAGWDGSDAGEVLAEAGLATGPDDCALATDATGPLRAAVRTGAAEAGLLGLLARSGKTVLRTVSPLQALLAGEQTAAGSPRMTVSVTGEACYIVGYDAAGGLRLAEALPCAGDADLTYYIHTLAAGELSGAAITLVGPRAASLRRHLRRYFAKVTANRTRE